MVSIAKLVCDGESDPR
jgi:hypothetical protein